MPATAKMTTYETVTSEQIRRLRTEAESAGDAAQVRMCTEALDGLEVPPALPREEWALAACVRAINAAAGAENLG